MLSETIYTLRRKSGLSQEQLAERIGVSRQAVSKWESGQSVPELDKLQALSQCFHVTMDQLTGEGAPEPGVNDPAPPPVSRAGVLLCLLGGVCLCLFGALMLIRPAAVEELNASSVVTLNGSGVLLGLFLLMMAAGIFLIFRKK